MTIQVYFHSYFKDLTGRASVAEEVAAGATLGELLAALRMKYPKLEAMKNSTLTAVGVDYQDREYVLREGDEVSLFPPVQGG